MPSTKLSSIIKSKSGGLGPGSGQTTEQNIERGKIWTYSHGTHQASLYQGFCWQAPGYGTAVIEIWGASGGGGCMCCCGSGIPGNPGAYAKKTITVAPGCFVCGQVGKACQEGGGFGWRGCSDSSGLVWTGCTGGYGCICAQGGMSGCTTCSTTPSPYCCLYASGYCGTLAPDNCGLICNWRSYSSSWMACAFGGDVNCCGGISCTNFWCCYNNVPCSLQHFVRMSAGIYSTAGAMVVHSSEEGNAYSNFAGNGAMQLQHGLNALSRTPAGGVPFSACWQGALDCGCYVQCYNRFPAGVPANASQPCAGVRDGGNQGGAGQVRIRFY